MISNPLKYIITLLLAFCQFPAWSAHLVGGEITYKCLGNNNYEITMIIYRDGMSSGAPFDPQAVMSIYDVSNNLVDNNYVPLNQIINLPVTAPNNCTSLPTNVATEKGIYIDTVNLPPILGGYVITHQRCCRNNTITNINNTTSLWGSTYTTSIPSMDNCNSSPKYKDDPPVVLCVNQYIDLDLGATDLDGDSLYYELCSVLHGGSNQQGNVMPDPAAPPPYSTVPFLPGYTTSAPITSNPQFTIDPQTGILSGRPTQVGQFVFAICVSEYDNNGMLLSTTRRDFQFNVSNACKIIISLMRGPSGNTLGYPTPDAAVNNPISVCDGRSVDFETRSQWATTYFWDFGDTNLTNDTSNSPNPSYFYQDTGTYLVMHVAEPYTSCADTAYAIFKVFDSVMVVFEHDGDVCFETNSIDFSTSGSFSKQATFKWSFGGQTNLGFESTADEPKGVSYTTPGTYVVTVEMTDFTCTDTYTDTVTIYPNPVIDEIVERTVQCVPYTATFTDLSTAHGRVQHFWIFGDGYISYDKHPVHTYTRPGTYTVEHIIKTFDGCKDSAYSRYVNAIVVNPVPESRLSISTDEATIYDPVFEVRNASSGHNSTTTYFPDGEVIENFDEKTLVLSDTGDFEIIHISYNQFGCTDTLIRKIRVETPFNLFIPNSFSPNGDGINDLFSYAITNVARIQLEIYNRWGEMVFMTNDPSKFWNGRKQNSGEVLPPGVYSFVLIARVKSGNYDHIEKGVINLIR